MRNRSLVGIAALIMIALAPSAASAQVFGQGPWSGLYVGLHGGYNWNNENTSNITGGAVGLHLGYNLQLSSLLLGIEGDYGWSQATERNDVAGARLIASTDNLWSVRARLGWVLVSNLLIYGTVGYGGFNVAVAGTLPTNFGPVGFRGSADFHGIAYGGGAELLLTRNVVLRAEVLMYAGDGNSVSSEAGFARLGVSYKF